VTFTNRQSSSVLFAPDLPGVGRNDVRRHRIPLPDLIRLATWARLERRPAGLLVADTERRDDAKLRAIAEAQQADLVRAGDPFDLMAVVIAMSMAWSPVSNVYAATIDEPAEVHARRRDLLRDSVRRAVAPD
jgi:hypothetical protein